MRRLIGLVPLLLACSSSEDTGPEFGLDLASLGDEGLRRVYGSTGDGSLGLPVAGGLDVDGDGLPDVALGAMQATPLEAPRAGEVLVVFGDGTTTGAIDSAEARPDILRVYGSQAYEYAGSEIWIDDVTGDAVADVIIARQNYSPGLGGANEVAGAGAVSVVVGGAALRAQAERLAPLELGAPPPGIEVFTLVGAAADGRLGIWLRSGDVTGDGIADLVLGADLEAQGDVRAAGAAYVIRGGPHLSSTGEWSVAAGASPLSGHVARLVPPATPEPNNYHFGATCQIADLDGNGRGEVLVAAALSRAGAVLDRRGGYTARGSGGPRGGRLYIAWDDNFPAEPWPENFGFAVGSGAGSHSIVSGSAGNGAFGEELLGGLDWDVDGTPDLYVGDLTANLAGRPGAGSSHVIYDAARLRGLTTSIGALPTLDPPIRTTTVLGANVGDISGDTAAQGDFSGDGVADLVVCSPHANALRRASAGALHVFYGRPGGWPALVDLRDPALGPSLDLLPVYGAHGTFGNDTGDTLCYSAAAGDLDGDGRTDLIANEMVGNGLSPAAEDVGNLVIIGDPISSSARAAP
jgi:hypothetical protein